MTAGVLVITFIIGALIGYIICMTQWIMQLEKDSTSVDIEIAKVKAKLERALREEVEDGNDVL